MPGSARRFSTFAVVAVAATASAAPDPPPPAELLIVASTALAPSLAEFVAFKQKTLPTRLVELETAISAGRGVDDPEKLKRFVYDAWRAPEGKKPTLRYLLLVGDADVLPVRYMVLDRNTPAAFDYAFYPSDLYYADLAKADGAFEDWNAAKDGFHKRYFGEVRGEHNKDGVVNFDAVDYRPEIGVGRWPVSTPEETKTVAAKTIAYETGAAGRAPRVGLVATAGWGENRPTLDAYAKTLGGKWLVERRYWGGPKDAPGPDTASVVDLVDSGVTLLLHSGHGYDDGWDRSIGTASLPKLHDEDRLPILMSAGCSTARLATLPPYEAYVDVDGAEHKGTNSGEKFEAPPPPPAPYQRGKCNPSGMGEQWLRAGPRGAAAYIGCDTGSQPCAMTLMAGLVDAVAKRQAQMSPVRLGDCWADSVSGYFDREKLATIKPTKDWYPPSVFFQGMKFLLLGDPSIPVVVPK